MDRIKDIIIIVALSRIMIQLQIIIEQSMLMLYYQFYEENCLSLRYEWMTHLKESVQTAYEKVDKHTPRNWRIYNEGKDSGDNE